METITKEEFEAYEAVRISGVTNMFAVTTVGKLSGLSREKICKIMDNYSELMEKFSEVRQCCVCGGDCEEENDCWVCKDKNCKVHEEEN